MTWLEFEPMVTSFERMKTVHALDRAATVIGQGQLCSLVIEAVKLWIFLLCNQTLAWRLNQRMVHALNFGMKYIQELLYSRHVAYKWTEWTVNANTEEEQEYS
jgi:hypothetical protein